MSTSPIQKRKKVTLPKHAPGTTNRAPMELEQRPGPSGTVGHETVPAPTGDDVVRTDGTGADRTPPGDDGVRTDGTGPDAGDGRTENAKRRKLTHAPAVGDGLAPVTPVAAPEPGTPASDGATTMTDDADEDVAVRVPPAVHLEPNVALDKDGRIEWITLVGRTPSPFPGRMGDHTTSWIAVTDALRARLHGRTLPEATAVLRTMHTELAAAYEKEGSPERNALDALSDDGHRKWLIKHTLDDLGVSLTAAEKPGEGTAQEITDRARANVARAIALCLALRNYLPFATVDSGKDRGSTGGGEGRSRRAVLAFERGEKKVQFVDELRDRLWNLWDGEAALRSTGALTALDGTAEKVADLRARMSTLRTDVEKTLTAMAAVGSASRPPGVKWKEWSFRVKGQRETHATAMASHRASALAINAAARKIGALTQDDLASISAVVGEVEKIAGHDYGVKGDTPERRARDMLTRLSRTDTTWSSSFETIESRIDAGVPRAAEVLAWMVHEFQQTAATAYGRTVVATDFLTDGDPADAAGAAGSHLGAVMDRVLGTVADVRATELAAAAAPGTELGADALAAVELRIATRLALRKELVRQVQEHHAALAPITTLTSTWARNARFDPLVVSYRPGAPQPLAVNGRAPSPMDFEGQGAHTTAWVVETMALNELVRPARGPGEAVEILQAEIMKDLTSKIMKLDHLLPADSLGASQLDDLVVAARAALSVDPVGAGGAQLEKVATQYLTFRNLLPFATVDSTSTIGHHERSDSPKRETFDRTAMDWIVRSLQKDLADPSRFDAIVGARLAAADELEKQLVSVSDVRSVHRDAFRAAVEASVNRLRRPPDPTRGTARNRDGSAVDDTRTPAEVLTQKLRSNAFDADVATIFETREEHHGEVWELAHRSDPSTDTGDMDEDPDPSDEDAEFMEESDDD